MELAYRLKLSQRVSLFVVTILTIFYAGVARADHSFAYICSDGNVYSVRVRSANADGYNSRGAWFKFENFCRADIQSSSDCRADRGRKTLRCYQEFREKGNLGMVRGTLALWPSKIRHSPTAVWFDQIRVSRQIADICTAAIRGWDCDREASARSGQLKCLYERSGPNNRALGRNCFTVINTRLSAVAQDQRRRLRSGPSVLAGN